MENNNETVKTENINSTNDLQNNNIDNNPKKTNKKKSLIIITIILVIIVAGILVFLKIKKNNSKPDDNNQNQVEVKRENKYSEYQLKDNTLSNFDLYFLQLENNKKNMIYSPLSIKYVLEMLNSGAEGETKNQITDILGTYVNKKYTNNRNMSFANALFVRNSYKDNIKTSYIDTLLNQYNATVAYDDFKSANTINNWVSNKTFKLINNAFDDSDIKDYDFVLANALAIDMDWVNKIQDLYNPYTVDYKHENFHEHVTPLTELGYHELAFKDYNKKTNAVEFAAVVNKYDIINELGEDNIRKTVSDDYNTWLKNGGNDYYAMCSEDSGSLEEEDKLDLDKYVKELSANYQTISSSTDFQFYVDDSVKVFAKDLKKYNGTTLQYIGIMPTDGNLSNYIKNINASSLSELISKIKPIAFDSFKDGVITDIHGYIPMFKFDYKLDLVNDLNTLGIKDVFDSNKANLSNLTTDKAYIGGAKHKATIDFSNDGIKAGAFTAGGGAGAGGCGYDYQFKVPVEDIDLTFDKPYMFIIRDKDTNEVWFAGTVYEPTEYNPTAGLE